MPAATLLEPQLVDRAPRPPEGDNLLHEIKYDGYRLLASCERGTTRLYSRSGADWTARLPWIANAITSLGSDLSISMKSSSTSQTTAAPTSSDCGFQRARAASRRTC